MKENQPKTVVVWGASLNPGRYSNKAVRLLKRYGHQVIPVGLKNGEIDGIQVIGFHDKISLPVHTVTLYVSPKNQPAYYDKILALKPKRVIFNPGTENPAFERKLKEKGIETVKNCTLVMLRNHLF